ncbi:MAG: hypothetical protein ACKVP3_07410 [Hyphomicrobiaceae bacterium]
MMAGSFYNEPWLRGIARQHAQISVLLGPSSLNVQSISLPNLTGSVSDRGPHPDSIFTNAPAAEGGLNGILGRDVRSPERSGRKHAKDGANDRAGDQSNSQLTDIDDRHDIQLQNP